MTTKNALTINPDDPNASGNHRKNLVQSVDASLKRLNKVVISNSTLNAKKNHNHRAKNCHPDFALDPFPHPSSYADFQTSNAFSRGFR